MQEFIDIISERYDFKKINPNLYNFRCPFCGDSYFNERKKRGYLIEKNNKWYYYCHNCGISYSFKDFLKNLDSDLYQLYVLKTLRTLNNKKGITENVKSDSFKSQYSNKINSNLIQRISDLPNSHPGYQYLKNRNVPASQFKYICWTNDFSTLVKTAFNEKYEGKKLPKEGIVFILRNLSGKVNGFQFRNIGDCSKQERFVTCSIEDDHFFYTNLNLGKKIYVVEGCIDSLFLENGIAVLCSSLYRFKFKNAVYINDCEPRNKEICNQIKKCINYGYEVALLPDEYEGMDINDMINYGVSPNHLMEIINNHSYSGMKAKIIFSQWKKY